MDLQIPIAYLDHNHFNTLAKDNKGEEYKYLESMVEKNAVRFVYGFPHVYETAKCADSKLKEDLIKTITHLTKNICLRHFDEIVAEEIRNAFYHYIGQTTLIKDITVLSDTPISLLKFLFQFYTIPELKYFESAVHVLERLKLPEIGKSQEVELVKFRRKELKELEKTSNLSYEKEVKHEFEVNRNNNLERYLPSELPSGIIIPSESKRHFLSNLKKEDSKVLETFVKLSVRMNRDRRRNPDTGDLGDLEHLSVAIPHVQFVVTENFFANIIKQSNVQRKFGVEVYSNLGEFIKRIKKL